MINMIAIARGLNIPHFVIFDADTDCSERNRKSNKLVNRTICNLMDLDSDLCWPEADKFTNSAIIWTSNFQNSIANDVPEWFDVVKTLCSDTGWIYARLKKNPAIIARALAQISSDLKQPPCTKLLSDKIKTFASGDL